MVPGIDTSTGATYWGVGNPAPFPGTEKYPNGSSRPGPNLYTESEISLNSSGQLQWYQQIKPHDNFDLDFQISPILTTATVNGMQRNVVIGSGKTGYVVAFDAQTGEILWKTTVCKHQRLDAVHPPGKVITIFPGILGSTETPMALASGVIFASVNNIPSRWSATKQVVKADQLMNSGTGELYAIDVNTGNILWQTKPNKPDFGATTVVGDLVFTALYTGQVLAFDLKSGQQAWSWQAPDGINGFMSVAGNTLLIPAV